LNDGQVDGPTILDHPPVEVTINESWLTGISEDFKEFFTSDSLEQSWISSQSFDWGIDGDITSQAWQFKDPGF
jgi:hypothetical protein